MSRIFINGKFTAQRTTGVQRLALGLVEALDNALATHGTPDQWVLLCPQGARPPALRCISVQTCGPRRFGLHFWEQLVLPWASRHGRLLNLSGPAPLAKRGQVCMVPDAAVFDQPAAYTKAFGTWYRFLFRRMATSAALLLTISRFSQSRLVQRLGIAPDRMKVVPCAATHMQSIVQDDAALQRLDLAGARYLLAVGSANPTKNLSALIEAFARLPHPDLRLVLVGGTNTAVFAGGAAPHEDARIVRTGPVSDGQLKSLYANALAFVFPSLYEGFGLPPLEAMSLGCPVVASNAASVPEVCGDAALYFDPSSVAEMATAMTRVVDDAGLRGDLSRRGTQRFATFTWEAAAQLLLRHLEHAGLAGRSHA
ncbi:glycosyltransferase family 1 protein [Rhizobacter sp. OV335]|jgi:glycosyltransferase involved in cell wall biosynthesis|uniref:glycosyltransferase family 4 protein n=1 Tax=Rhizobacter sp. OV335 TaxID=1500264 RepID=UPI000918A442|nr:glycosyltransferase family 1 protein [Rhizobacter sp. OV335]SHL95532.1 Glycosyltransferase involved in cell wall bisynthesis [Rhizobacter sp. OV335]